MVLVGLYINLLIFLIIHFNHTLILIGAGHNYVYNTSSVRIYSYSVL